MGTVWIEKEHFAPASKDTDSGRDGELATRLAAASIGDTEASFELGVAFSTGSLGAPCDLVEAHKWFNLAALGGHEDAPHCRAEVAEDMTAREIGEAQRRARQWLGATPHARLRRAA